MSDQFDWNRAFTDFDGWRSTLDSEQQALINERLKLSHDTEAERQRFLAVGLVADRTGHDPEEVSNKFETLYMPQFAVHEDGLAMPQAPASVGEFFAGAQATLKRQVIESEAAKQGANSALSFAPRLTALREYQAKAGADYSPSVAKKFLAGYDELNGKLAPHRGRIGSMIEIMRRKMDGAGEEGDDDRLRQAALDLADMDPGTREIVSAVISGEARKHGEKAKAEKGIDYVPGTGLAQETGESAARIFSDMFGTMADSRDRDFLRRLDPAAAVETDFPAIISDQDANEFVSEQIRQAQVNRFRESIGSPAAIEAAKRKMTRELDAEERALVEKAKARMDRVFAAMDDIRRFEREVDPIRDGVLSVGAATVGSSAVLLLPGVLGPQGMALSWAGYANSEERELAREYPDMKPEDRGKIALLSASIQAPLDMLGVKMLSKLPSVRSVLTKELTANLAARAGGRLAATYGTELGVEVIQNASTAIVQDFAAAVDKDIPGLNMEREIEKFKKSTIDAAIGLFPLTLIGTGLATVNDFNGVGWMLENNQKLGEHGVIESDRVTIIDHAANGRIAEAEAALRDADKRRMPEVAAEFAGDAAGAKVEAQQALDWLVNRGGYNLAPAPGGTGEWIVTTPEGPIKAASRAEAIGMLSEHFSERELKNADAVAEMADFFAAQKRSGERIEVMPGRKQELSDEVAAGTISHEQAREAVIVAGKLAGLSEAESSGMAFSVLGSNRIEEAEGEREAVSRIYQGANVLTVAEETVEGRWRMGLERGRYTAEQGRQWVRLAEEATGEKFLHTDTERGLIEAISHIVTADVMGRRKDGSRLPAGLVTRGLLAATRGGNNTEAGKFSVFLRSFRELFRRVFSTARKLAKAKKEGKLDADWDGFLDDLLGIDTQGRHDSMAANEAGLMVDPEYKPPTPEQEAAGMAFSVRQLSDSFQQAGKFYRVVHGEAAFRDVLESGLVRTNAAAKVVPGASLLERLKERPTAFPSFSKDYAAMHYAQSDPNHFIIVTEDASLQPSTSGRHSKGKTHFPTNEQGEHLSSLPADKVDIFRHVGDGIYQLAFTRGKVTSEENPGPNGETFSMSRAVPADASKVVQMPDGAQLVGPTTFSIRAYHGTPHKVDKFTTAKIGTGEGAQAYGWGLYMAESREVAEQYRKQLSSKYPVSHSGVIEENGKYLAWVKPSDGRDVQVIHTDATEKGAKNALKKYMADKRGNLYTVELLPDADEFLDWDKPLSEQSEKVKAAFAQLYKDNKSAFDYYDKTQSSKFSDGSIYGSALYARISMRDMPAGNDAQASKILASMGVKGIKYLDAGSRGAGDGTRNFVIFDENLVRILEENGKPVSGASFSLMPARRLEAISQRFVEEAKKNPIRRAEILLRAQERFNAARLEWRALMSETRTMRSIEREAATRLAFAYDREYKAGVSRLEPWVIMTLEAGAARLGGHPLAEAIEESGGVLSRSEAMRAGLELRGEYNGMPWVPPKWYGTRKPDVLAQEIFDNHPGLLRGPMADDLWDAMRAALAGVAKSRETHRAAIKAEREMRREAMTKARTETDAWTEKARARANSPLLAKERLLAALRTLDAILSALPPEVRAKVGGFVKLAELQTDEARAKELARRVDKIEVELEKYLVKDIAAKIEAAFDKARPSGDPGEQRKGKLGAEAHGLIEAAESYSKLDEAGVIGAQAALEQELSDSTTPEQAIDIGERMHLLDLFGGLTEKTAAQMSQALDWLTLTIEVGKSKWRAVLEARANGDKALRADGAKAIGIEGIPANLQAALKASRKVSAKSGGYIRSMLSFEQTLNVVFGRGSHLVTKFTRAFRTASNAKTDALRAKRLEFTGEMQRIFKTRSMIKWRRALFELSSLESDSALKITKTEGAGVDVVEVPVGTVDKLIEDKANAKALGFSDAEADSLMEQWADNEALPARMRKRKLAVLRPRAGKPSTVELSQLQAVHLSMMARQAGYSEILASHGWDSDAMDAIEVGLTTEARQIREWLASQYEAGYTPLNEVFQRLHGVALPKITNYAPGTFDAQATPASSIDPYGANGIPAGGMKAGMLKTRRVHSAPPRLEDALTVYWGHIAATEHFKAFAEPTRELKAVTMHRDVRLAMESKARNLAEKVNAWVTAFEQNGLGARDFATEASGIFRRLQSNQSYIALAYNLGSLMKQSTAALGALLDMPTIGDAMRAIGRLSTGKLELRKLYNSDFIQRRMNNGYSPEVRQANAAMMADEPSRGARFIEFGMEALSVADAWFTTASAAMAYDFHFREAKGAGLTDAQAEAEAMMKAEETVARTAQPVEMMDRSTFELGLSPMAKFLFMFATEARQKAAILVEAYSPSSGLTAQQRAMRIFILHVAIPAMVQTITNAWRDLKNDDDEEVFDAKNWRARDYMVAMALGPLTGLPLLGTLTHAAEPLSSLERGVNSATGIKKALDSGEPMEAAMKSAVGVLDGAALLWGGAVPAAVAADVARDIFSLADNVLDD